MSLSSKQKKQFKAQAHHLKPIVLIGNKGLTEAVSNEIERALDDHELIKVRIMGEDRTERLQLSATICQTHQAELIQILGRIAILYRKNPSKES